jgi:hypothetical protein
VGLSANTRDCRAEGSSLESDVDFVSAEINVMIKGTKATRYHSNGLLTLMESTCFWSFKKHFLDFTIYLQSVEIHSANGVLGIKRVEILCGCRGKNGSN